MSEESIKKRFETLIRENRVNRKKLGKLEKGNSELKGSARNTAKSNIFNEGGTPPLSTFIHRRLTKGNERHQDFRYFY